MKHRTLYVVAGVVRRGGRILIARRDAPAELAGMWEFPGGKIRRGETPEAALRREWREEFGMSVTPLRRLGETVHHAGTRSVRLVFVEARADGNPRFLAAHEATAWVYPGAMGRYRFAPADRLMVRHIVRRCGVGPLPSSPPLIKPRRSSWMAGEERRCPQFAPVFAQTLRRGCVGQRIAGNPTSPRLRRPSRLPPPRHGRPRLRR